MNNSQLSRKLAYFKARLVAEATKDEITLRRLIVAKTGLSVGLVTMCVSQSPIALTVGIVSNIVWLWVL